MQLGTFILCNKHIAQYERTHFQSFLYCAFLLPKTDTTDVKEDYMRTEPVTMNEFAEAVRQDLQERLSGMYPQLQVNIQHVDKL